MKLQLCEFILGVYIQVYSLGCFLSGEGECNSRLVSMVIGEEQPLGQVESEVGPILASGHVSTTVMYVISLGKTLSGW